MSIKSTKNKTFTAIETEECVRMRVNRIESSLLYVFFDSFFCFLFGIVTVSVFECYKLYLIDFFIVCGFGLVWLGLRNDCK